MLQQLYIQNYAIIEELSIDFTPRLNVITGETGAGKSILMGALGLILGDRADTASLLNKDVKCIVEGRFATNHDVVKQFLEENDLDVDAEIFIRREISPQGKSRAFINDTPVTLVQLKSFSALLVDLHRQFDTRSLSERDFQMEVLDALAGHNELLQKYRNTYGAYRAAQQQLQRLIQQQEQAGREQDYNQFLYNELEEANFSADEIETLEAELKLMGNSEEIKETFSSVALTLQDGEEPLLTSLKTIISKLAALRTVMPALAEIVTRLESAHIEMKDIADEIDHLNAGVEFSEARMNEMNERMSTAYSLLKKHQVQTTAELLSIKNDLSEKLRKAADITTDIAEKEAEVQKLLTILRETGHLISANRKKQIAPFTKKVNQLLHSVGMPNAALKVQLETGDEPLESGLDTIVFLFDANKTSFQPIQKVASGGELSRLMLIIKSLVAASMKLPTLIFDEIDTGISGEAARQVGIIIKELSAGHQVLLITHQPQIAARATTHFFVFKEEKNGKITTGIKQLNDEERIRTIATMLSGDAPTAAAFENAREMMN